MGTIAIVLDGFRVGQAFVSATNGGLMGLFGINIIGLFGNRLKF
jgi:hypothetical protein